MFIKIIATLLLPLAMIITSFLPARPLPKAPESYIQAQPEENEMKTYDKISGINDSVFYISRPKKENYKTVSSADFGMSAEAYDNCNAFKAAVDYCRLNPGTVLKIEKGTYFFRSAGNSLNNLKDIFIDGSEAEFIFTVAGTQIPVEECSNVEISGLTVDWNREADPIEDIVRITGTDKSAHTVDLEFFLKETVCENMIFSALSQCDPESFTFGDNGECKECYMYMTEGSVKKAEKLSENTIRLTHDGCLDGFAKDETYILRHYVYGGETFAVRSNSSDITFDNVKLYGSSGAGYYFGGNCTRFQIINSVIGVDPSLNEKYFVSLGADAIHIVNTSGFFRIENCDISRQGDDAVNVHDGLGYIKSVSGNCAEMYASAFRMNTGDKLKFKDSGFNETGFEAVITCVDASQTVKKLTFDRDISSAVKSGYIAYNTAVNSGNYVIRNNYFHENRARALLLQSSNGLCENNRFYKTHMQAIKIIMDIIPSLWQEGTGVDNLAVRNNTFEKCSFSKVGSVIEIGTSIDGHEADCEPFTNIEISSNEFINNTVPIMEINNVNGLLISGNTVNADSRENRIHFKKYSDNVTLENNTFTGKYADTAQIIKADKFTDWVMKNSNK